MIICARSTWTESIEIITVARNIRARNIRLRARKGPRPPPLPRGETWPAVCESDRVPPPCAIDYYRRRLLGSSERERDGFSARQEKESRRGAHDEPRNEPNAESLSLGAREGRIRARSIQKGRVNERLSPVRFC
jgi:hypothetical protein